MVRRFIDLPGENELNDFLDEFQRETQRAAPVLGAAYLDAVLEKLLRDSFATDLGRIDKLFDGGAGPLGTFSAKIRTAYALGLLTKEDADDLHLVRRIRNRFAHAPHRLNFETQQIHEWCENFECNRERFEAEPDLEDYPRDPRSLFDFAVALMAYYLIRRIQNATRTTPARPPLHLPYEPGAEEISLRDL